VITAALLTVGLITIAPAFAAKAPPAPSKRVIAKAIKAATHSSDLWATINFCNPKKDRGSVGVRAQMPALGFATQLDMAFKLEYWSSTENKYLPAPNTSGRYTVERSAATGVYQFGVDYPYGRQRITVIGRVTFSWIRDKKVLGSKTVSTTAHHPSVNYGDPAHSSVSTCTT
jgi:hypothetical protein